MIQAEHNNCGRNGLLIIVQTQLKMIQISEGRKFHSFFVWVRIFGEFCMKLEAEVCS